MSTLSPAIRAAIYALSAFGIFTIADTITKILSRSHSTYQVTLMVFGVALLMVLAQAVLTGKASSVIPRYPKMAILRSVLISVDTVLIFYSFSVLPLTDVYIVAFTNPMMVSILAFLILKERLTWLTIFAIVLGFIGVVVALQPGSTVIGLGHLTAFTAIFLFALSILVLRVTKPDENDAALVAVMFLMLTLIGAGMAVFTTGFTAVSLGDWLYVLVNAACTVIGNTMLVQAFRLGNAGTVAPFQYTQLIWGTLLGYFVFGDAIELMTIIGAAIIILSGLIVIRQGRAG